MTRKKQGEGHSYWGVLKIIGHFLTALIFIDCGLLTLQCERINVSFKKNSSIKANWEQSEITRYVFFSFFLACFFPSFFLSFLPFILFLACFFFHSFIFLGLFFILFCFLYFFSSLFHTIFVYFLTYMFPSFFWPCKNVCPVGVCPYIPALAL